MGTEDKPVVLAQNEKRTFNKEIVFPIPTGDKRASISIRADIVEFDSTSENDDFTADMKMFTVEELAIPKKIVLLATDDESKTEFTFHIEPIF